MLRATLALLCVLPLLAPSLPAQNPDDNLFIPPKLTVSSTIFSKPRIVLRSDRSPSWTALLPHLYFDYPGGTTIPERYDQFSSAVETREYVDRLGIPYHTGSVEKYRQILNIVGYRMSLRPEAILTLQGGYSTEANETAEVAIERAHVVREYLDRVWSIDTGRIRLLEPAMRADTFENNALQEEGRRVEFASEDPEVLAPVHFSRIGFSAIHSSFDVEVTPNVVSNRVDSIIFRIVDHTGEVRGRAGIEGDPDSVRYRLRASWESHDDRLEEDITIEAHIRTTDGMLHPSNRVYIPVVILEAPQGHRRISTHHFFIPFDRGDSTVTSFQRNTFHDLLAWITSLLADQEIDLGREGYLLLASGKVDYAEDPDREAPEVNTLQQWSLRSRQAYDDRKALHREQLSLSLVMTEFDGTSKNSSTRALVRKNRQIEEAPDLRKGPGLHEADSLADGRARSLLRWIATLELPTINDELPERAYRLTGVAGTELLNDSSGAPFSTAMREGLLPAHDEGRHLHLTPEERAHSRGVLLEFWTRDHLEFLARRISR